jgi:hypothetical protein
MKKIYIKFGEPLPEEEQIYVYEAIIEDNFVKIIIPSLSYHACISISKDLENPAYVVEGRHMGKERLGYQILRNYRIISKLTYDKENENYIYNDRIESPKVKQESLFEKPNFSKIFKDAESTYIPSSSEENNNFSEKPDFSKIVKKPKSKSFFSNEGEEDSAALNFGRDMGKFLGQIFFKK